jgi:mono/diheme cytochrome c family protein
LWPISIHFPLGDFGFAKEDKMRQEVQIFVLAAAVLTIASGGAFAQERGDAQRGLMVAETTCAQCHATGKGQIRSRNGQAPTFASLANTPGMTPMALGVWMRSGPHREMPNLVLTNNELDDVSAYILSLK